MFVCVLSAVVVVLVQLSLRVDQPEVALLAAVQRPLRSPRDSV